MSALWPETQKQNEHIYDQGCQKVCENLGVGGAQCTMVGIIYSLVGSWYRVS